MHTMYIATYLQTRHFPHYPRMHGSYRITFLSSGRIGESENCGWPDVQTMRDELRRRNRGHADCEDIPNGIRITPHNGYGCGEKWQDITLDEPPPISELVNA